jgi:hypothetical protein
LVKPLPIKRMKQLANNGIRGVKVANTLKSFEYCDD